MVLSTVFLGGVWGAASLKIISGDMCGRNDLKSKVSTLEELYDFFSENTQKLHQYDVIFGAVDILSTGSVNINL